MTLEERIAALGDAEAARILGTLAKARGRDMQAPPAWTPELKQALAEVLADEPDPGPVRGGDAARDALLVLAEDPEARAGLSGLIDGPKPQALAAVDPVTGAALVAAILVVLQTHVKIQKDAKGKWTFLFEKKAASAGLLRPLLKKLLALF